MKVGVLNNNSNKPNTIVLLTFIPQMTGKTSSTSLHNYTYFDLLSEFQVTVL